MNSSQSPLSSGKAFPLMNAVSEAGGGTTTKAFSLDAEAATVWIHVNSVEALQIVSIKIYGHIEKEEKAKKVLLVEFDVLDDSNIGDLLFRQTGASPSLLSVEVVGSGASDIDVWVRGASSGESSVRILGNNAGKNYLATATTTPTVAVPAAVTARSGVLIHNNSSETVYWGFTAASATVAIGQILPPNTPVGIDIAAGVEIYASVGSGTAELRIAEAGV